MSLLYGGCLALGGGEGVEGWKGGFRRMAATGPPSASTSLKRGLSDGLLSGSWVVNTARV